MSMIRALERDAVEGQDAKDASLPHVLLVLDQFSRTMGGGERIALKLAALLPQYGYRASILTFSIDPESPYLKSLPCPFFFLPLRRVYDVNAMRAAFELKRFLRQQQVRIVQTFFETSDLWAGFVTKTMSDAKLIWSRRDMGILRARKHQIAYRLMAGVPETVFAVSDQVRQHCINVDRIDPARVFTIYNGLDIAGWDTANRQVKDSGKFLVSTVGNIRRVKGHDIFIKAAAVVVQKFPDVAFSIAGEVLEPEYFKELEELVRELNLTAHFRFDSGVSNLREYLPGADIFVLPSRSEGFSNAIIEAMAASLPVVATGVGGNAEAVKEGVNGFIVPSEDVEALSSAILRLLSDPLKAQEMGAAGRELVKERFTIDAMMNQITHIYASLLRADV
ncbi:MAG: glycosyltransferase family 4 protein [Edaphobacter sp.]